MLTELQKASRVCIPDGHLKLDNYSFRDRRSDVLFLIFALSSKKCWDIYPSSKSPFRASTTALSTYIN